MGKHSGPSVRDRLLQAGVAVFSRSGFNGSNVQDVTEAAGVPKRSFYNHFDSKEALGAAAIVHHWNDTAGPALAILGRDTPEPLARLRLYFEQVVADVEGVGYACGCFVRNVTAELSDHSTLISDQLSAILLQWTRHIAGCIRLAQATGGITSRADPEALATSTLNALEGALPRARVTKSSRPLQQFSGAIFTPMKPFAEREAQGLTADAILASLRQRLSAIEDAFVITIAPPPVAGIGNAGGFKMMLQDQAGLGPAAMQAAAQDLAAKANGVPGLVGVFSPFNAGTPTVFADIDRVKAEKLGVAPEKVFEALQVYLGSAYVNDFNHLGRTFQVTAQADGRFRTTTADIARLKTRNAGGAMVPIGSVASFRDVTGPYRVPRYNLFPAAEVQGGTLPGVSSGQGLAAMETLAKETLPAGIGFAWTDLAFQQRQTGNTTLLIFAASVLFVFMVLAAQYESWSLPLSIVLIVPMCLLAAVSGLLFRGMAVDILAQIGFVVLVGLASKNAILIVEFAKQAQDAGAPAVDAAVQAARTRLRPTLMTSFAFVLGVVPLVTATGTGAELRQSLGTAVFFGMLGVTGFGRLFTPLFYTVIQHLFRAPADAPRVLTQAGD